MTDAKNTGTKIGCVLLFLLFFSGAQAPKVILFYGDSLTAGYLLDSPEQAFPKLVEEKLNAKGRNVRVINAGLSGETTAGGLTRIDWVLRQPVDVFVLELGANDMLRGLPLEQTEKNLQAIIDKVKTKYPDVKILITGMRVLPNLGEDYRQKFEQIFPTLAKKNNATLMPFLLEDVAGIRELNIDGNHPTPEGHRIVATNLIKYLEPLL